MSGGPKWWIPWTPRGDDPAFLMALARLLRQCGLEPTGTAKNGRPIWNIDREPKEPDDESQRFDNRH